MAAILVGKAEEQTLKAIIFNRHGESEVLQYADVPTARPAAGEVLFAVRAVSVNHGPDIENAPSRILDGHVPMPHIGGIDPAGGSPSSAQG